MTPIDELCKIISRTKPATVKEANYHSEIAPLAFASRTMINELEQKYAIAIKALESIGNGYAHQRLCALNAIEEIQEIESIF